VLVGHGVGQPAALVAGDPSSVLRPPSGATGQAEVEMGACSLSDEEQAIAQAVGSGPEQCRPFAHLPADPGRRGPRPRQGHSALGLLEPH
jgi:hypothetical protein